MIAEVASHLCEDIAGRGRAADSMRRELAEAAGPDALSAERALAAVVVLSAGLAGRTPSAAAARLLGRLAAAAGRRLLALRRLLARRVPS